MQNERPGVVYRPFRTPLDPGPRAQGFLMFKTAGGGSGSPLLHCTTGRRSTFPSVHFRGLCMREGGYPFPLYINFGGNLGVTLPWCTIPLGPKIALKFLGGPSLR